MDVPDAPASGSCACSVLSGCAFGVDWPLGEPMTGVEARRAVRDALVDGDPAMLMASAAVLPDGIGLALSEADESRCWAGMLSPAFRSRTRQGNGGEEKDFRCFERGLESKDKDFG